MQFPGLRSGDTALHLAYRCRAPAPVLELLTSLGVDPNAKNDNGELAHEIEGATYRGREKRVAEAKKA